ncbi:hypothetical protein HDU83_009923 [Entophlyctis luteolus]|nr:hypothetical protein HDU83_009923 [Entophlyctis luteolus]
MIVYLHDRCVIYYSCPTRSVGNFEEKPPLHVTEALLDLGVSLNQFGSSRRSINPTILITALNTVKKSNRRLLSFDQQDAHELLSLVSGHLTDEELPYASTISSLFDVRSAIYQHTPRIVRPGSSPTAPSVVIPQGILHLQSSPHTHELRRFPKNPLTGLMAGIMSCTRCGYRSAVNCAVFNNISLAVPNTGQVSIERLLQSFVAPENIHDYVCDKCTLIATGKRIDMEIAFIKGEISSLQQQQQASTRVSSKPAGTSSKKKKVGTGQILASAAAVDAAIVVSKQIDEQLTRLRNLEKDRQSLAYASKYNVEMKLPKHITLTKTKSPLTTKQIVIATPPKCLCLHMQRSVFLPSGRSFKNNCRVVFGEYLDISGYCLDSGGGTANPAYNDVSNRTPTRPPSGWADLMLQAAAESVTHAEPPPEEYGDSPPPLSVLEPTTPMAGTGRLLGGAIYSAALNFSEGGSPTTYPIHAKTPSAPGVPQYLYRLHSVVVHYGSHDSGHFVTYRRCAHPCSSEFRDLEVALGGQASEIIDSGNSAGVSSNTAKRRKPKKASITHSADAGTQWFKISDSSVELVRNVDAEVFGHASQFAYMLFYERVFAQ